MKALDAATKCAALPLAAYKKLYEIEAAIRDREPEDKLVERQKSVEAGVERIGGVVPRAQEYEQPSSPLGAALRYFTNHHVALGRFLEYGLRADR